MKNFIIFLVVLCSSIFSDSYITASLDKKNTYKHRIELREECEVLLKIQSPENCRFEVFINKRLEAVIFSKKTHIFFLKAGNHLFRIRAMDRLRTKEILVIWKKLQQRNMAKTFKLKSKQPLVISPLTKICLKNSLGFDIKDITVPLFVEQKPRFAIYTDFMDQGKEEVSEFIQPQKVSKAILYFLRAYDQKPFYIPLIREEISNTVWKIDINAKLLRNCPNSLPQSEELFSKSYIKRNANIPIKIYQDLQNNYIQKESKERISAVKNVLFKNLMGVDIKKVMMVLFQAQTHKAAVYEAFIEAGETSPNHSINSEKPIKATGAILYLLYNKKPYFLKLSRENLFNETWEVIIEPSKLNRLKFEGLSSFSSIKTSNKTQKLYFANQTNIPIQKMLIIVYGSSRYTFFYEGSLQPNAQVSWRIPEEKSNLLGCIVYVVNNYKQIQGPFYFLYNIQKKGALEIILGNNSKK